MTLLERVDQAIDGEATSMLFSLDELHTVQQGLMDTSRLTFITNNWGVDLDDIRLLTDLAVETMPLFRVGK